MNEAKPVPPGVMQNIVELKRIETELGHLPPETWAVDQLQRRASDPEFPFHASQLEQRTELLFGDICDELTELGFTPAEIAQVVNAQLFYTGGPRYCSAEEVADALGIEFKE